MAVNVGSPDVELQEFLGQLDLLKTELPTLLLSYGMVGLLNQVVTAGRRDDLLMLDLLQCWKFSNGLPATGQLVGADRLWAVEFVKQASQERSRSFSISALQQDVEYEPLLVHGPPEPVTDTANGGTNFIYVPPVTPTSFPVTQLFSNERREADVPLAKRVTTDLKSTLLHPGR